MSAWRLLQLADSGFPVGGFAHSAGLEAAMAHGHVAGGEAGVAAFARASLVQTGSFALPFVREAWRAAGDAPEVAALVALDRRCDRAQLSHVARRASRAQGRAWARTAAEVFGTSLALPLGHLPVAVGATARALAVAEADTLALFVFLGARGVVSAAIRLGALGPSAAQRVLDGLAGACDAAVADGAARPLAAAAHTAPLEELFGTLHDHLPARLFQS